MRRVIATEFMHAMCAFVLTSTICDSLAIADQLLIETVDIYRCAVPVGNLICEM